jgi:hypothetical protein
MSESPRRGGTIERDVDSTRGTAPPRNEGARAVGDGGRKRRGLLPWLLGGLALLALAALLVALLSGGDDKKATSSGSSSRAQPGAAAGAATLTAGSAAVLPGKATGVGDSVGETARGRSVVVQSVVQAAENPNGLEGFWVGSSKSDRVYVEYGGDVGGDEAAFKPKVGQKVNLEGPVKAAPEKAARVLNLSAADAALVTRQGAYINASQVTPVK